MLEPRSFQIQIEQLSPQGMVIMCDMFAEVELYFVVMMVTSFGVCIVGFIAQKIH
jgi:hypothetical protein